MLKRMIIMLVMAGLLFGGIFGYQAYMNRMIEKSMSAYQAPPVTVSTIKAEAQPWQPEINAVGSLRAARGVDVTTEVSGLVKTVYFKSGDAVKSGDILVQLNADADIAQLRALEAEAELARTTYDRDKKQLEVRAVSQATLDMDAADMKSKQADVKKQEAIVEKKTIHAPFSGKLGISTINVGQYMNPGDKIVTLQSLDPLFGDFFVPQQDLSRISLTQKVIASTDAYPGRTFDGMITAINPKVDSETRNVQVEASLPNPGHKLLPGMFVSVKVESGGIQHYITLPKTSVTFNPYGDTVYVVKETGKGPEGKPVLTATQTFVTTGDTRGDQIAVLEGLKTGDTVVTSGQLKLKSGSRVVINNEVQPGNDPSPEPVDQ
jgi:membrane fusion protein (multidrug efflux system)